MQVPAKPWYTSKMFWLGAIQIIIGVLELVATEVMLTDGGGWMAVVSGAFTIILRYVTKQPLTFTGKETKTVETKLYMILLLLAPLAILAACGGDEEAEDRPKPPATDSTVYEPGGGGPGTPDVIEPIPEGEEQ